MQNSLQETYEYTKYVLAAAFHPTLLKTLWAVVIAVFSFLFDPTKAFSYLALFILILVDFVTGVAAAKYLGEPVRSSKTKHTGIKMTAYYAVISAAHLAEYGLADIISFLDETVLAFFMLTELISLLENVGRMGVNTPKKLLNQLIDTKNKL